MNQESQKGNKLASQFFSLLFIVFVWFIFSSPYFIKNNIPFPAQYMDSFFSPWNVYPQYQIGVKNNALSDVVNEIYPWKHFTVETLKSGQIPFWNPYSFSGTPHLANDQSAVLSPFTLLFLLYPFIDAWSMLILLQPLLAGIFMFLFVRSLRISTVGSLLASIAFMFCGFVVTWMPYGTMSMAIAFLPLVLFAIEKNFQRVRFWSLLLLSLSLATSFLSGHFQISFYLALYTFSHFLFRFFCSKSKKAFFWTFLFYVLGIGIASLQIIPTLQQYNLSLRSNLFSNNGAIPFQYLITMIAPDFFGNPTTRNDWFGYYAEWSSFIGIIPFSLALIAVVDGFRRADVRRKTYDLGHNIWFFFIAGLVSLLLALNTPLQNLLAISKLPIFSTSIPSRIIILFSFSFCVLAGFGFDILKEHLENKTMKRIFIFFAGIGSSVLLLWVSLLLFHILPKDKTLLAAKNFILPSCFFFLIVGIISLPYLRPFHRFRGIATTKILVFALLLLTMLDGLRFAIKWIPFDPVSSIYPNVPVISAMQKDSKGGRVFGDLGAYIDTYYHLPTIEGYDPLYNRRYGEFIASATNGTLAEPEKSIVRLNRRGKYAERVLDLLGVSLIYHQISYTNQPWAFPVWDRTDTYPLVYQDNNFQLYGNKQAMPRTKVFYTYKVTANDSQEIKQFYADNFDFRNTLLLEQQPSGLSSANQGKGQAKIVSYTPNQIVISVMTDKPGLLFLSDTYYPAWKVTVNGRDETIYRADYAFRGVRVPTGRSLVKFFYSGLL